MVKWLVFIQHFCTLSTPRALYRWPHSPIYTKRFLYTFFAQVLSILYSHPDECIGEHLRVSILPKSTCSLEQPVCNHKLPISRWPMLPPELQPQMEKLQLLIHSGECQAIIIWFSYHNIILIFILFAPKLSSGGGCRIITCSDNYRLMLWCRMTTAGLFQSETAAIALLHLFCFYVCSLVVCLYFDYFVFSFSALFSCVIFFGL